jgi:hypothetical protein
MKDSHGDRIDRALRRLGATSPRDGLEDRILARLEQAAREKAPGFLSLSRLAVMFAVAGTVCAVIVAGSVTHSHNVLPVAPGLHLPIGSQPGVGAASAARVAPQPVKVPPRERPRSIRKTENGRAVISPDAKKHGGVAVPKPLAPRPAPEATVAQP